MDKNFKSYLFNRNVFVSDSEEASNPFETLIALRKLFGIEITEGLSMASVEHIKLAEKLMYVKPGSSFYKNFPESVRNLTENQILFDKLYSYYITYGLGKFDEARHSILEDEYEATAFNEEYEVKKFRIVTEAEAEKMLQAIAEDMMKSSRPLSSEMFGFLVKWLTAACCVPENIVCKETVAKLIYETKNISYARMLNLADVIKLVDYINFNVYGNTDIKKLNLRNTDRKFITSVIHAVFDNIDKNDVQTTFKYALNKRKIWNGLLHHLHFKSASALEEQFLNEVRSKHHNMRSAAYEQTSAIEAGDINRIFENLGSTEIIRNLEYIISRCDTDEKKRQILKNLKPSNGIVLLQLLASYEDKKAEEVKRSFSFTKHNMYTTHVETEKEAERRKSRLTDRDYDLIRSTLYEKVLRYFENKTGRNVYIDLSDKYRYALPISVSASNGGIGRLAAGTRIKLDESKVYRFFTYWEEVDDIDLSALLYDDDYNLIYNLSWITFCHRSGNWGGCTFSGDETAGFNGGSEYLDFDLPEFKRMNPDVSKVVLIDNVYSGMTFDECFCKAGYMLRDKAGSGEIYEPKTVQSSFVIDSKSQECALFEFDLNTNELIILNAKIASNSPVASDNTALVRKLEHMTDILDLESFFGLVGSRVDSPKNADIIVTDKQLDEVPEDKEVIHPYDFEAIMKYMQ